MGFYIKKPFLSQGSPEINEEMAKELLFTLFHISPSSLSSLKDESVSFPSKSDACQHIGEYIEDLMYARNFSSVNITIHKDADDQLIFNLNKTE